MYQRVLVVAAHPDDEILGAGGTIARLAARAEITLLFLGTGCESVQPDNDREREAMRALRRCGVQNVGFCRYPDQRLDAVPEAELADALMPTIARARPDLVITHHAGDVNRDHIVTHRAVMVATRPKPGVTVKEVWAMEVPSSTEWGFGSQPFVPSVFVDITDHLLTKMAALAEYKTVVEDYPHPRSFENVKSLSCYRGAQVGVCAAEAFVLLRRTV